MSAGAGNGHPARILVLSRCTSSFGESRGGADVLSRRHAELLARAGAEVTYVGNSDLEGPGISTVLVHTRDLLTPRADGPVPAIHSVAYKINEGLHVVHGTLMAARQQRREPSEIVLSNSSLSTILLRMLSCPGHLVHYVHDGLAPSDAEREAPRSVSRRLVNGFLEKVALRSAEKVICASDRIATQAELVGIPRSRLSVMYPLLRGRPRRPSATPAPAAPTGDFRGAPFLLSVGQQTGRKRFEVLIEALRGLPEEYHLVLVGNGPFHDTYRAKAEQLGLKERVVFLRNIPDAVLDALYEACSGFVLASDNEGFPITVAEALSHGSPVVLACPSTVALAPTLSNEHVVLLRELSGEAVAAAIRTMLARSAPDPQAVRREIRRWALERLPSDEKIRQQYEGIFGALLDEPVLGGPAVA